MVLLRNITALLMLMMVFSIGCKKNNQPESYFTYKDKTYELNEGILEYWGVFKKSEGGYNFDISLFSAGLYFDTNTKTLVGSGEMVYFETFSSSDLELVPGTYSYDEDATKNPLTFDLGQFWINLDVANETGTLVLVSSGTLKIDTEGSVFELVFEYGTSTGNVLKGVYRGGLDYYDRTIEKGGSEMRGILGRINGGVGVSYN